MNKQDGMNYAPKGKANIVVQPGEYSFAACGLDHGHINGMCNGLLEAGATLKWVYDPDPAKVAEFCEKYPEVQVAESEAQIMTDPEIKLVATACIPCDRADMGIRAMKAGKDCFIDKTPITTLDQLARAKATVAETGRRFFVYFSERLHVESAVYAGQLIEEGAIGRVIQVTGLGPHRLGLIARPDWFYDKEKYGGILCDIGAHQLEQFLFFTGNENATIVNSQIANYNHPETPGLDDYGDMTVVGDNGTTGFFRLDWFTPDGLRAWGDGRMFIQGTEGYIELRKYLNVAESDEADNVYMVNASGEYSYHVNGQIGFPFFGQMILDSIHGTETAMTQAHIFKSVELGVIAQSLARKLQ